MERVVRELRALLGQKGRTPTVVFLTGAGCSTACGIPDFRSLGGMHDTLKPELLTASLKEQNAMRREPTQVVSWNLFRQNPLPYLELRRSFILDQGLYKPSLAHTFMGLCDDECILLRTYTHNIDGLEFQVPKLSALRIIPVHGSLSKAACENCGYEMPFSEFKSSIREQIRNIYDPESGPTISSPIVCEKCSLALVKPTTVLYGRSLPGEFFERVPEDLKQVDILFIVGTSLTVSPANQLVSLCGESTLRVLVNRDLVGQDLGFAPSKNINDIFLPGSADETFLTIARELGWESRLRDVRDSMANNSKALIC